MFFGKIHTDNNTSNRQEDFVVISGMILILSYGIFLNSLLFLRRANLSPGQFQEASHNSCPIVNAGKRLSLGGVAGIPERGGRFWKKGDQPGHTAPHRQGAGAREYPQLFPEIGRQPLAIPTDIAVPALKFRPAGQLTLPPAHILRGCDRSVWRCRAPSRRR